MEKGFDTKYTILKTALKQVRKLGFEAISIGNLAKEVGMSKSGLFAHFKSKETLSLMVLDHSVVEFTNEVFRPGFKKKRGLPRLNAFLNNWMTFMADEVEGGCALLSAAIEYDDRPGKIKDRVALHLKALLRFLEKACMLTVEAGEFKKDTDCKLLAFQIHSIVLGFHIHQRTLGSAHTIKMAKTSLKQLIDINKA
ncbi:MAG: AcrR family transcriptional regulator [Thermoproteota archaeon]|jgi:AcrR family transcriptional regulator